MYLSRIQLTETFASEPLLANILRQSSYGMHQLLWELFEEGSRHLFREENSQEQIGDHRSLPVYYVLSEQQPKPSTAVFKVDSKPFLPQLTSGDQLAFRLRANPTVSRREQGKKNSVRHDVVMDARYQHLLHTCIEQGVLNPAEVISGSEGKRQRVKQRFSKKQLQDKLFNCEAFADVSAQRDFQNSQKEAQGTAAQQWLINRGEQHGFTIQSLQATGYQWHALIKRNSARNAGFSSMDYEGMLKITDSDIFISMLKTGLGPSKAFGCGLMMIRRI